MRKPEPDPVVRARVRDRDEADICETTRLKKFLTDSDEVLALRLLRLGLWFPSWNFFFKKKTIIKPYVFENGVWNLYVWGGGGGSQQGPNHPKKDPQNTQKNRSQI